MAFADRHGAGAAPDDENCPHGVIARSVAESIPCLDSAPTLSCARNDVDAFFHVIAPGHLPPRGQRGFVLPLTLAVLAAVMIVAAYYADTVRIALIAAQMTNNEVKAQEHMFNLRAEALFRMAVDVRSRVGLGVGEGAIRLDGQLYKSEEGALLQMQDSRGLINVATLQPAWWRNLLRGYDIPDETIDAMLDILGDYVDADSLRRLNGAEADDYAALGLPPPRNAPLITPGELRMMPVWRDQKALWDSGFRSLLVVANSTLFNPNTASWQVLMAIPGVTRESAKTLVSLRDAGGALAAFQFASVGAQGIGGIYSPITSFPSDTLVLTLWEPSVAWGVRSAVMLTPSSLYGPWRIQYVERVEKSRVAFNPEAVKKLPERVIGAPEQPQAPGLFGSLGGD